jgi:multidrug resistance efflux pump
MRKTVPVIAVIAFVFAVGAVLAMKPVRRPEPPPSPPPTARFASSVAAVGLLEANTENINVSCAVSGMVTQLYVKAGDHVQQGQKLFSLDDRDLRADLAVKRTALNHARAQLAKLTAEPRPEELPPLEAKVTEAQAMVADAEVQVELIESVTDSRAVRKEDVLRRRQNLEAAKARLAQAANDLALAKAGAWAPDLEIARTEVGQAEAAVRQDQVNIDRLTTRALVEGNILQNKVRLGQYAQCGPLDEPLMILGNVTPFHVRVDVDEHDAWRIREGAVAEGSPRGNGSQRVPLQFVRFEPYVIPKKSLTGDSTERVDTRVLQIIYRVKDQDAPLYVGQQMDVYIETPIAAGALHPHSDSASGHGK